MSEHYYSKAPQSAHQPSWITLPLMGKEVMLETDAGVFSRQRVDPGSELLIQTALSSGEVAGRVLDLGCGYGPIGISLALSWPHCRIEMAEINQRALALAKANLKRNGLPETLAVESDGFESLQGPYTLIVTNPPIRAGKDLLFSWFEQSIHFLVPGGRFMAVIRKAQGAPSAQKKLTEVYGGCETIARGGGYHVLCAQKS